MDKLKATILSLSLITVMADAAVSPALGAISNYFIKANPLLIKLIISLPALFIILTSLLFITISSRLSSKTIAIWGLFFYTLGGSGAGFANNIYLLLGFRIILGVGVGLIMPLSTGLIAYYFDRGEQSKLMGYSSAMNNLGAIIALALSGFLVSFNWRYSFAIYFFGLVVMVMVLVFLPGTELKSEKKTIDRNNLRNIVPYISMMFLTMLIFFTFPSNFAMIMTRENVIPSSLVGLLMSLQSVFGLLTGMSLTFLIGKFGKHTKYFGAGSMFLSFFCLNFTGNVFLLTLGLVFLGAGFGTLVPLLNAQLSLHVDREKTASAMAMMSAMLYLGQFMSPIIIDGLQSIFHLEGIQAPFNLAMMLSIVLLISLAKIPFLLAKK